MSESFSPKELFLKKIRLWWFPFLMACTGAFIGLLVSIVMPANYEAIAEINLAIDFSKIGMVTDIEQDQIIEMVGDICKSDMVLSKVLANTPEISADEFNEIAQLERRNVKWVFKIRHSDADFANKLVHLWQETAYREIQIAYNHAILVDTLSDYMNHLSGCFEQSMSEPTGSTSCSFLTIPDIQTEMDKVADKISEEQQLSQGISPAISVSMTNEQIQPANQISGSKVWLLLAGGVIGFLAGIWGILIFNKRSA